MAMTAAPTAAARAARGGIQRGPSTSSTPALTAVPRAPPACTSAANSANAVAGFAGWSLPISTCAAGNVAFCARLQTTTTTAAITKLDAMENSGVVRVIAIRPAIATE